MPLDAGTRLGSYEVISLLGAGGMGEVYRARDSRLGRDVAIKILPANVANDPDRLARFEREARAVAALNHPNIVTLHSIEDADGTRFLTMELVEGESLDQHVAKGGIPIGRILEIGIAIAEALTAAQEKGIVHRDLKPANVMLTRDGRVKVLDFGLAKLGPASPTLDMTQGMTLASPTSSAGMVVGTIPYMAPEQVRGEAVDARADLFALGVILYELATGKRPFGGATAADVGSAILRDSPDAISEQRSDMPAELDRIISCCLEKAPLERFQSALYLCRELRRVRSTLESGAPSPRSNDAVSIAVLPFVSMSQDPDNEYFSDGLAEELLNVLTKIRGLRVAARSSSFAFKGKGVSVAEVGRALRASAVLEGSVRKSGNRVRIAVQLVEVAGGYPLWSESYDRTLDDIFAVQDDIAQSVVKELRRALLGETPDSGTSGEVRAEVASAAKGRGHDPEAHRLYLEGRYFVDRGTSENMVRGIDRLRRAIERAPGHALAWAELGAAYSLQAGVGWTPQSEGQPRAREAARRALELEPDLVEGHVSLGSVQMMYDFDWRAAQASHDRALELAPHHATALLGACWLARAVGEIEASIAFVRRAIDTDPLSSTAYSHLGISLYYAGHLDDAEAALRQALELAPGRGDTLWFLASLLMDQGRLGDADEMISRQTELGFRLTLEAIRRHRAGEAEESNRLLADLIAQRSETAAYQIAQVYAVRQEADAAFDWLRRAHRDRDAGLVLLILDPIFAPLHGDPRWAAFLQDLGLLRDGTS